VQEDLSFSEKVLLIFLLLSLRKRRTEQLAIESDFKFVVLTHLLYLEYLFPVSFPALSAVFYLPFFSSSAFPSVLIRLQLMLHLLHLLQGTRRSRMLSSAPSSSL
jgi:hypothetical protein